LAAFAKLPQNLEAIELRQHHIEKNEIEAAFERSRQSSRAIVYRFGVEPLLQEVVLHERTQVGVILDE
jgi:hypothetical protein